MANQVNIQEIGDEAIYVKWPGETERPTPKSGRELDIPAGYKELRRITDSTGRVIWAHKWRINATGGTGGSASANPTRVKDGQTSTLSASASSGYSFSRWSDGNTQNPRTITVTDHTSLTASFGQSSYRISVNANGGTGGSANPSSYSISSSQQTSTLTRPGAPYGKEDNGWTVTEGSGSVSGNTLIIPSNTIGDITVRADWKDIPQPVNHTLYFSVGSFPSGYSATVSDGTISKEKADGSDSFVVETGKTVTISSSYNINVQGTTVSYGSDYKSATFTMPDSDVTISIFISDSIGTRVQFKSKNDDPDVFSGILGQIPGGSSYHIEVQNGLVGHYGVDPSHNMMVMLGYRVLHNGQYSYHILNGILDFSKLARKNATKKLDPNTEKATYDNNGTTLTNTDGKVHWFGDLSYETSSFNNSIINIGQPRQEDTDKYEIKHSTDGSGVTFFHIYKVSVLPTSPSNKRIYITDFNPDTLSGKTYIYKNDNWIELSIPIYEDKSSATDDITKFSNGQYVIYKSSSTSSTPLLGVVRQKDSIISDDYCPMAMARIDNGSFSLDIPSNVSQVGDTIEIGVYLCDDSSSCTGLGFICELKVNRVN